MHGNNGAGKTNILEAISLLSPGRGLRRAKLQDMLQQQASIPLPWAVRAIISSATDTTELATGIDSDSLAGNRLKRLLKINGTLAGNQSVLAALAPMVWLTPKMDRLFIEGATERRRWLDRTVYNFFPSHLQLLKQAEHLLKERQALLQSAAAPQQWLHTIEETLATVSMQVAENRWHVIDAIAATPSPMPQFFPHASLHLEGFVEKTYRTHERTTATTLYRQFLAKNRFPEANPAHIGQTDFIVFYTEKNIQARFCSTGEQKALLLFLTLTVIQLLIAATGKKPIVLLDEVAAHLDASRRAALYESLQHSGCQCWLTGVEKELFSSIASTAQFFLVERNSVLQ